MTIALVANIARPISSALSSAFSMDAVGKLDTYGKLGSWSPLSLFASSEVGAWYDPSDLTTMFQDSAGTTPVTADGQPVGKILDKSGNGNHATAPSDAARPLYKTDGTYHWLQFDGVDDGINSTSLSVSQPTTHVYGFLIDVGKTEQGTIIDGVNTRQMVAYQRASGTALELFAGSAEVSGGATVTQDQQYVITTIFNGSSSKIRKNAVDSTTINPGANSLVSALIGKNSGNSMFHKGNIYSLIIRGALSTTDEITATETWVNSKTGAY